ncbi:MULTISPECIES: DUF4870 domain-containing protein [Paenibacillus]|uniref:DUF4870 domain-containing protein n=1 Tax=Paenibacillus TaxID=44249 RepID=UPI0009542511|nr:MULTISPECIES: DUF4870 domain-containing protein [Paenibacillus]ASS67628.1 DUF4870 domain-containing protein [Paenibacillus sp. RUD330]SIQ70117.1 Uncharacterized membrane protein [Paenibacillus sp. RU4X]SIQ91944.1 Uncharacterized membrane protein [Paenibacillus sp. RU4T]
MHPSPRRPDPSSTGLDPRLAAFLGYLGSFVGAFLLLLLEKKSRYVRFHAVQSILFSAAYLCLSMVFALIPVIGWLLGGLLAPLALLVWIGLMIVSLQGKQARLPVLGDWAEMISGEF